MLMLNKVGSKYSLPSLTALVCVTSLLLSSCAGMKAIDDRVSDAELKAEKATAHINSIHGSGAVILREGAKIGGREVKAKKTERLPAVFDQEFSYLSAGQSFASMVGEISRQSGVKIVIQPASPGANAGANTALAKAPAIDWRGDLRGLIDTLANSRDLFWKYQDGAVYFYKTETRVFNLFVPGGKQNVSATIALSGVGGGDTAGSVDVNGSTVVDAYEAITKSVELLVADGATGVDVAKSVLANSTLGMITVTGTPSVLNRVEAFINGVNERFAKNVLINVKVYNLTYNRSSNAGVSADVVYSNLARNYNLRLVTPPSISPTGATPGSFVIGGQGGALTGSQAIISALEQVGKVSFVTQNQVIAANGQPSPMQIATEFTYLASSSTTTSTNVGSTTTLTPGTRTVGFTANFLPLILGDNRIMLQYQINLSSLLGLDSISSGGSLIQTPNIAMQTLQQKAFVRDGEAIVLFGYEQERASTQAQRFFPGISRSSGSNRTMMVIIMEVFGGK